MAEDWTIAKFAAHDGFEGGWWVLYQGRMWDGPLTHEQAVQILKMREDSDTAVTESRKAEARLMPKDMLLPSDEEEDINVIAPGVDLQTLTGANPKQLWGDKKLKVQWVPPAVICALAEGLGEGGAKYGPYNWRDQPVETMTYYGGAMRHLLAWLDGEDIDPDSTTGKSHLAGALSSLAILVDAIESGYAIDNRPKPGGAPRLLLSGARNESLDPDTDSA